jgi:hypothetical protein
MSYKDPIELLVNRAYAWTDNWLGYSGDRTNSSLYQG